MDLNVRAIRRQVESKSGHRRRKSGRRPRNRGITHPLPPSPPKGPAADQVLSRRCDTLSLPEPEDRTRPPLRRLFGSSMDDISFVAAAGATVVAGLMMWWACGRYQSRLKRALFGVAAVFLGFFAYFVLGILFVVMRPDVARETGSAIFGHGVKTLSMMLLAVNIVVLNVRRRPKAPRPGA